MAAVRCTDMEATVKSFYCRSIFVLLLGASAAWAQQTVHKSTMKDGTVVYSEKPVPGALKSEVVETPTAKTGVKGLTPEEKARAEAQLKQRAQATQADTQKRSQLDDARRAVTEAEAAVEKGKEPLPGERTGTAGGGSRLNDAYYSRQKGLEDSLAAARKRLAEVERTGR